MYNELALSDLDQLMFDRQHMVLQALKSVYID